MKTLFLITQSAALILAAPLLSGVIRKIKNSLRMRQGAPVLQPYYNLMKLFGKSEVISGQSSWIFRAAPYIVLGASITALLLTPAFITGITLSSMGDLIVLLFILALGRFFLVLAGLDTGSAFGGMGSSREMFISSLVEPVALVSVFAAALPSGSTGLEAVSATAFMKLSSFLAFLSLFAVTLAETSRIPIDNQETHLELTMVHEAMVLEYSGRSLALIELAAHVKQVVFFSLLAVVFIPFTLPVSAGSPAIVLAAALYAAKVAAFCVAVAVTEISLAKMRLFRVVDFLAFALVLAFAAFISFIFGV